MPALEGLLSSMSSVVLRLRSRVVGRRKACPKTPLRISRNTSKSTASSGITRIFRNNTVTVTTLSERLPPTHTPPNRSGYPLKEKHAKKNVFPLLLPLPLLFSFVANVY